LNEGSGTILGDLRNMSMPFEYGKAEKSLRLSHRILASMVASVDGLRPSRRQLENYDKATRTGCGYYSRR
jgi:hypothetical protein